MQKYRLYNLKGETEQGAIEGGTYSGTVYNGARFKLDNVTNYKDEQSYAGGTILGGVFDGTVVNNGGTISNGVFNAAVTSNEFYAEKGKKGFLISLGFDFLRVKF